MFAKEIHSKFDALLARSRAQMQCVRGLRVEGCVSRVQDVRGIQVVKGLD